MRAAKLEQRKREKKRKSIAKFVYNSFCYTMNVKRNEWNMNAHFMRQIEHRAFVAFSKRNNMESDCFTD